MEAGGRPNGFGPGQEEAGGGEELLGSRDPRLAAFFASRSLPSPSPPRPEEERRGLRGERGGGGREAAVLGGATEAGDAAAPALRLLPQLLQSPRLPWVITSPLSISQRKWW